MADGTHQPTKNRRFSWFKSVDPHHTTYRLFRRSLPGRVLMRTESFSIGTSPRVIARRLKAMRRELLEEVDAIDFRYLGITEDTCS